jgi:parallel beta-helix repeat protein
MVMRRKNWYRPGVEVLESRLALSTYYVSATGSDALAGTSDALAWHTLQHAADAVRAGDTVVVRAGSYTGFDIRTSGTAASPITFRADPGTLVNARNARTPDGINLEGASYVVIDGFEVDAMPRAGIRSVTNDHVTIRNNKCDRNYDWGIFTGFSDYLLIANNTASNSQVQHGIYVSNSCVAPVVRGNTIFGNYAAGIHMNGDLSQGGTGLITGALVEGNVIHDNGAGGGSGINCDGVQGSVFRNNLLYNNHASGISLYRIDAADGAKNNVVVNNTILEASDARWCVNIQNGSTGNTLSNNVLYNYSSWKGVVDISADSLAGFASDYNVVMDRFTTDGGGTVLTLAQWRAQTGQDQHSLVSSPAALFVNPAANNYHLLATSPAVDAGTAANAPPADLDGNPRPSGSAIDIGAYEYVPAGGVLQFSTSSYSARENAGSVIITVTRTGATGGTVTVSYATANGTATAGADYTATQGTLTFATGDTSKTFSIPLLDDSVVEGNETVKLTLSAPTGGARLGSPAAAVLTIRENDGTPNQRFVAQAYIDVLGREVDPAGLALWSGLLDAGSLSRTQLAQSLDRSLEYRQLVVKAYYLRFLHRTPDDAGLAFFANYLQNGGRDEDLIASLVASPEYFNRAGGTNRAFVAQAYLDILRRVADPGSLDAWTSLLNAGTINWSQFVQALANSTEYRQNLVQSDYLTLLQRVADNAGQSFWVGQMQAGMTDEDFMAVLVGCQEYFNQV